MSGPVTSVHRALPRRGRRTVGAWCFADHAGPGAPGAQVRSPLARIPASPPIWLQE